jgi:RNA recognition motif-containing protein
MICNALHEAPMSPRIYVGGLPSSATDTRLRLLCAPHGTVKSAGVIRSKITGQSFGYGFVEMGSAAEAGEVILLLNGTRLEGQRLDVFSVPGSSPW